MDISNLISQIPIKSAKDAVNVAQGLAIEKGKQIIAGQQQLLLDEVAKLEKKLTNLTKEYAQKFDELEKQVENKELTREKYDELIAKEKEAFENEKDTLTKSIKEKKDKIVDLITNGPAKIKAELKAADDKIKGEIAKTKKKLKGLKIKRSTRLLSKVKTMIKNNPSPLILASLTIAAQLVSVRNKKIEELVDNLNEFIDNIKTPEDVRGFKISRQGSKAKMQSI